jgi:ribosome-binding ATPase YchF (GTP1/OBG family)
MLIGLIGRPSSGKSTFFKASTLANVLIADYPFATIKPNHGVAYVKVKDLAVDFDKVSNPRDGYVKSGKRFVPFELMDVAGLVEGASQGKGLGNAFLNDLAAADAFIHVVDMSGESDGEGKPVSSGDYYPGLDIKIIEKELDLWYLGILKKAWKAFARTVELQEKKLAEEVAGQFSGLKVSVDDVKVVLRNMKSNVDKPSMWSDEELMEFSRALRRESKKMIIAANKVDRPNGKANFEKVKEEFDYPIVACFAEGELALREADKHDLIEYIPGDDTFKAGEKLTQKQADALQGVKEVIEGYGSTGVQEVLNSVVFDLMEQVHVYPAGDKLADSKGNVLPDCYLMKKGSTALDFAFRLHTDIGNGFVKAISIKSKQAVGKDYEIQDGDGLEIMTK